VALILSLCLHGLYTKKHIKLAVNFIGISRRLQYKANSDIVAGSMLTNGQLDITNPKYLGELYEML